jgi:hypothetical protein
MKERKTHWARTRRRRKNLTQSRKVDKTEPEIAAKERKERKEKAGKEVLTNVSCMRRDRAQKLLVKTGFKNLCVCLRLFLALFYLCGFA